MKNRLILLIVLACSLTALWACSRAYYSAMEKIGVHKRNILVDRVKKARDSQAEAKKEFASALERFSSVVNVNGGDLEDKYYELKETLDGLEERAREVHQRIEAVEDVSQALFGEWEEELNQYHSQRLRELSARRLRETKMRYNQLIRAMKRAEAKINPVLVPLKDEVLFLKHNLNARAIASLKGELNRIQIDVSHLLKDMEQAVKEADAFIDTLQRQETNS